MACKRSAVRSRLAPPRFALWATRGARRSPMGCKLDFSFILIFTSGTRRLASAKPDVVFYILRSVDFPNQDYVGATANLMQRLSDHNAGRSAHTSKFKP